MLCNICKEPGACCRKFRLSITFWKSDGVVEVRKEIIRLGLPFEPIGPLDEVWYDEAGVAYGFWEFSCPKLDGHGRCSIYKDRPVLCRNYVPGSCKLCVMSSDDERERLVYMDLVGLCS